MPVAPPVAVRARPLPGRAAPDGFDRFVATLGFVGLLLIATIGTAPFAGFEPRLDDSGGDMLRQLLVGVLFALTVVGLPRPPGTRSRWVLPLGMTVLLGYCLLSVGWAIEPGIAIRRLLLTTMVVWMLFATVRTLGYRRTLYLMRILLLVLLALNYLTVAFLDFGRHPYVLGDDVTIVGDWRGILPHKNMAGALCAFTVLAFAFDRRRVPLLLSVAAIVLSLVFLGFSHSKTSQGVLAIAVLCGWVVRPYDASYRSLILLLTVFAAAVALQFLSLYAGVLEETLNDPTALTGRSQIWPYLIDYADRYLWTGAGFGSFWQIGPAGPIWDYTDGWIAQFAGQGHNGYLDLLVTIGLPGMLLAVAVLIVWPVARLLMSFSIVKSQRSLLLAIMVFCAGHNLTETSLLDRMSVTNVFLILAVALIHLQSDASGGGHRMLRERALRVLRLRGRRTAVPRMRGRGVGMVPPRAR